MRQSRKLLLCHFSFHAVYEIRQSIEFQKIYIQIHTVQKKKKKKRQFHSHTRIMRFNKDYFKSWIKALSKSLHVNVIGVRAWCVSIEFCSCSWRMHGKDCVQGSLTMASFKILGSTAKASLISSNSSISGHSIPSLQLNSSQHKLCPDGHSSSLLLSYTI